MTRSEQSPPAKGRRNVAKPGRSDYVIHHQVIETFLLDYLKKNSRLPTQQQIAQAVKMSRDTVQRHLAKLTIQTLMPQYKNLSPRMMIGLFGKAASGNPLAAKLWLQVVEGFAEKSERAISTKDDDDVFKSEDIPDALAHGIDALLAEHNRIPLNNRSTYDDRDPDGPDRH